MYKSRLIKWGLTKYNKRQYRTTGSFRYSERKSSEGWRPEMDNSCTSEIVEAEPSSIGPETLGAHPSSMSLPSSQDALPTSDPTFPASAYLVRPTFISTGVSSVNEMLVNVRTYIEASFDSGIWVSDSQDPIFQDIRNACSAKSFGTKSASSDLYTIICHSGQFLQDQDYHLGGVCLRIAFSRIKEILSTQDPFALWELMNTISFLYEENRTDLLQAFLRQLSNMSAILHTKYHPLFRIFSRCRGLESRELPQAMAVMRQCAADQFEKITGSLSISTVKLKLGWLRAIGLVTGLKNVEDRLKALLATCQEEYGVGTVQSLLVSNRLANSLLERKMYIETEALGHDILHRAASETFNGPSCRVPRPWFVTRKSSANWPGEVPSCRGEFETTPRSQYSLLWNGRPLDNGRDGCVGKLS